jgi:hypothetical protein
MASTLSPHPSSANDPSVARRAALSLALRAAAACTPSKNRPPPSTTAGSGSARPAVSIPTDAATIGNAQAHTGEAQAEPGPIEPCRCVGPATPREIVSIGEEHAHLAGYGGLLFDRISWFDVDATSVYYTVAYNANYLAVMASSAPGQLGRFSLGRLMRRVLSSGETRTLAEENAAGAHLVGGQLYWNEEEAEPYGTLMEGHSAASELRSVSINGGEIARPSHGLTFSASATHFYWRDGSTLFRKSLPDGAPTAVRYNAGPGRFVEWAGTVYWLERAPRLAGQTKVEADSGHDFRLLRLGENDDPRASVKWVAIPGDVEAHIPREHVEGDVISWWDGKCTRLLKLDGSGARCVAVKVSGRYGYVVRDDVAYARADVPNGTSVAAPAAIVQTPLSGPTAGQETAVVSCNDAIPDFKIASDRIVFQCRRSLWSVPKAHSSSPSAAPVDAPGDTTSHGSGTSGRQ